MKQSIRQRWLPGAGALLLALTAAVPAHAHDAAPCGGATPAASPVAGATLAAPVALDTAYLTLQLVLARQADQLASLALGNLTSTEIRAFALATQEAAAADAAAINALGVEALPADDAALVALTTVIDEVKMELDLPAGESGTSVEGFAAGAAAICAGEGPFDAAYIAGALDLARRQVDLAEVAAIAASDPAVQDFASAVIARESANLGALIVLRDTLPAATPAS